MELQNQVNKNIPELLKDSRHIAVVGLSNKPGRLSYGIGTYLIGAGYTIYPVNPNYDSIMGLTCYKSLDEIAEPIDIVNIFRRSEDVMPIVKDAIKIKTLYSAPCFIAGITSSTAGMTGWLITMKESNAGFSMISIWESTMPATWY